MFQNVEEVLVFLDKLAAIPRLEVFGEAKMVIEKALDSLREAIRLQESLIEELNKGT